MHGRSQCRLLVDPLVMRLFFHDRKTAGAETGEPDWWIYGVASVQAGAYHSWRIRQLLTGVVFKEAQKKSHKQSGRVGAELIMKLEYSSLKRLSGDKGRPAGGKTSNQYLMVPQLPIKMPKS